ncbi:dihydroorotate oxidase [Gloeocapsa sp. PCC 7428]|uniref:dihydroorotate dehydrogenase-like protein n=1 Tax=Gloeocapsa sp. PCC 7428 TaxID=1173026 RepID=UPI0002A604E1|nr:dihydroorotate dehydrogenase-like protein [Gloeocapsa sp. PCC 7428]AFZ32492.1 dihydroorotate oxidase [Gloeocapsa sp. PCC 7428]
MNLTTTYMGLTLRSPLVAGASPLSEDLDNLKLMEDAGAAAIVLHSLFEEQLRSQRQEAYDLTHSTASTDTARFRVGSEEYLNHIRRAKEHVDIPIIASLNGSSVGGWTNYARQIEQAGADALELNVYYVPTDMEVTGEQIEQTYINILRAVKASVSMPVAIKLSPYFTNMANMAKRCDDAGADALVLFNRFYQPDINLKTLAVEPNVLLSTPQAMRLPLRWIAILYGRINASLAATSGIHTGQDVVKLLMVGAHVTMLCSVLLQHGILHLHAIERELEQWMTEHEYESVQQLQGMLSRQNCPDQSAFERAQYVRSLQTYKPEWARIYESSYYFG